LVIDGHQFLQSATASLQATAKGWPPYNPGDFLEQGRHHGSLAIGYAVIALAGQAAAPKTAMSTLDELLLKNAFFLGSWSDPPDEMRRAFSVLAERFVIDHRDEIENLAIVLDQRRSLSGVEIAEIVGSTAL